MTLVQHLLDKPAFTDEPFVLRTSPEPASDSQDTAPVQRGPSVYQLFRTLRCPPQSPSVGWENILLSSVFHQHIGVWDGWPRERGMVLCGTPCQRPQGQGWHAGTVGSAKGGESAVAFGAGMTACVLVPGIFNPTCNHNFRV